jgi:PAS domain-containing protein
MKDKNQELEQLIRQIEECGVLDALGEGIIILNTNYKILYQNQRNDVCDDCPQAGTLKYGMINMVERELTVHSEENYFEITSSPLKTSKGEIIAGIEIVKNITKRKKMENELKKRTEELELFYETAVRREFKMKELKDEIQDLKSKISQYEK